MGRSASVYCRSMSSLACPTDCRPSQDTNSVNMASGRPYLAIRRRKTASVTLAIGARTNICFLSFSQKFLLIMGLLCRERGESVNVSAVSGGRFLFTILFKNGRHELSKFFVLTWYINILQGRPYGRVNLSYIADAGPRAAVFS